MKETIKFRDLSGSVKTAIVIAWILGILNFIAFFVGFITEIYGM